MCDREPVDCREVDFGGSFGGADQELERMSASSAAIAGNFAPSNERSRGITSFALGRFEALLERAAE
jgi:hypothetical protein